MWMEWFTLARLIFKSPSDSDEPLIFRAKLSLIHSWANHRKFKSLIFLIFCGRIQTIITPLFSLFKPLIHSFIHYFTHPSLHSCINSIIHYDFTEYQFLICELKHVSLKDHLIKCCLRWNVEHIIRMGIETDQSKRLDYLQFTLELTLSQEIQYIQFNLDIKRDFDL